MPLTAESPTYVPFQNPTDLNRMRIAIVEDSVFMRTVTKMTLRRVFPRAELFEFADASEALKALRQVDPDLITLDLLMPGMGGLEFLRRARRRKLRARIVVVTADVQPVVRKRCIRAGAHAFIEKPITLAKLQAVFDETPLPP